MSDCEGISWISRRTLLQSATAAALVSALPTAARSATARYRRPNVDSAAGKKALASYKKAIRAMLSLPPSDPRNWYRVALVHALDCPHGNWWFLPWHRGFLGWTEQICRQMSGDPDFAFPFWDWTAEPRIPSDMFVDVLTPTETAFIGGFDEFHRQFDQVVASMDCWKVKTGTDGAFDQNSAYAQLLARGLRNPGDLWFDIFDDPRGKFFFDLTHARGLTKDNSELDGDTKKTVSLPTLLDSLAPRDFLTFASPKTLSHGSLTGFGVLEGQPHNNVHNCVGGMSLQKNNGGFMQANLSPVDPIFFLHHSNIDRLWDVWTRKQIAKRYSPLPGGAPAKPGDKPDPRSDYATWVNELFLFFVDANGKPVQKTTAGDYVEIGDFDYDYEEGSGEEVVPKAVTGPLAALPSARTFSARIANSSIAAGTASQASVNLPPDVLNVAADAEQPHLFARVRVAFRSSGHAIPVRVSVGGDGAGASGPGFAGVLAMFGHHGSHGPVEFLVPLSAPVQTLKAQNLVRTDAPLGIAFALATEGDHAAAHATTSEAAAEILSVTVEAH